MIGDRMVGIWTQVAQQSLGAPVSVAHVCAAVVAGAGVDGAGVTVMVSPTVRQTISSTDAVAERLEELQLTLGQGPCVDTFAQGGPILAADLSTPESVARWPAFTPAAVASGALAVFALPLQIGAIQLGALDLYRDRPGDLSERELADALVFADIAGLLLLDAAAGVTPDSALLAGQYGDPTGHDAVVHQATGMVLVQLGAGADTAFARLRGYAFAHDRPLVDVARDVVARRLRFEPDPDHPGHDGD
jgi:hypothetical protein